MKNGITILRLTVTDEHLEIIYCKFQVNYYYIHQIYYNINKLFVLLHAYVGFGKEKNCLNFVLPGEGSCCRNWDHDYI